MKDIVEDVMLRLCSSNAAHSYKHIFRFSFVLLLTFLAGCVLISPKAAPPIPTPVTPTPTQMQVALILPRPLFPPSPTPKPTLQTSFDLSGDRYTHPSGLFSLFPPQNWTVQLTPQGAMFSDPQGKGILNLAISGCGLPLDDAAFDRLVTARERNLFSEKDEYLERERRFQDENLLRVVKTLRAYDTSWEILSFYSLQETCIEVIDIWLDQSRWETLQSEVDTLLESIRFEPSAANRQEACKSENFIPFSNDYFSLEVPVTWRHESSYSDSTLVDTFYCPNDCAVIQGVVYNDGEQVNREVAAEFTLELLRYYYGKNIHVINDVAEGGYETLTWVSKEDGYRGVTRVGIRGSAVLLLSQLIENNCEIYYQDILDRIWASYQEHPIP